MEYIELAVGTAVVSGTAVAEGTRVVAPPVAPVISAAPDAGVGHLSTGGGLLWAPGGKLVAVSAPGGEDAVNGSGRVAVASEEVDGQEVEVVPAPQSRRFSKATWSPYPKNRASQCECAQPREGCTPGGRRKSRPVASPV